MDSRPALVASLLGLSLTVLPGFLVSLSLPRLMAEMAFGTQASGMILLAYLLGLTLAALPMSAVAGRLGPRAGFRLGLVLMLVTAIPHGLPQNLEQMLVLRFLQGIALASLLAGSIGLLRVSTPPGSLGRALGGAGLFSAAIMFVAPFVWNGLAALVPSLSLEFALVLTPLVGLAWWLASRAPSEPQLRRFDLIGTLLSLLSIGLLIVAVPAITFLDWRWALRFLVGGLLFLALFVWHQSRRETPLLPLDLLARPRVTGAFLARLLVSAGLTLPELMLIAYFYQGWELSVATIGLTMSLTMLGSAIIGFLGGWALDRRPGLPLLPLGALLLVLGFGGLALQTPGDSGWLLLPPIIAMTVGRGAFEVACGWRLLGGSPRHRAPAGQGLLTLAEAIARLVAPYGTLLVAVLVDKAQLDQSLLVPLCLGVAAAGMLLAALLGLLGGRTGEVPEQSA
ncbi:MFS transporter [Acetobacteraceae bacterium H6797]|nr:MFS transporter [Acetobacteraceae bacterium H6797]